MDFVTEFIKFSLITGFVMLFIIKIAFQNKKVNFNSCNFVKMAIIYRNMMFLQIF